MDNRKILRKVMVFDIFIILCGILFRFLVADTKYYYTVVNNINVTGTVSENKVKYKYTIDSYDTNGNKKKLTFKTSKLLKDGTYLKLKVSIVRGVINYSKIEQQKLPKKVKLKYLLKEAYQYKRYIYLLDISFFV